MRALNSNPNVDNSDLSNYPDGRIKDNTGTGNGTGVNERVKGDMHQAIAKLMRLYSITPNGLPDNELNGFQIVEAIKSLASKNDYIYPLSSASGVLSVDIKLANMQNGEFIVCRTSVDKTTETQIKGFGATTFAITYSGSFKANEYVRVIKTIGGVSIVRLADATSLDAMVSDFFYLKKASQTQENAGTVDTVATTPLTNLIAFTKRVIGADSGNFLATTIRNGLYPKEHWNIVNQLTSPIKSIGGFSILDIGSGGTYTLFGDLLTATAVYAQNGYTTVRITLKTNKVMTDNNYRVKTYVEYLTESGDNALLYCPIFKIISASSFDLLFKEPINAGQLLKVHLEIEQYL